jgi:ribosomal protein L31E
VCVCVLFFLLLLFSKNDEITVGKILSHFLEKKMKINHVGKVEQELCQELYNNHISNCRHTLKSD